MLEKLYRELVVQRAEMALDVLDSPPQDWAGFQRRIGQYTELKALIDKVQEIKSGNEKDE